MYYKEAIYVSDDGTNNIAEAAAVYHGVKQAVSQGKTHLDIRTDSELITNMITGHYQVDNPRLFPYLAAICVLLRQTEQWCIEHIHREANTCADSLATEGREKGGPAAAGPTAQLTVAETTDIEYVHPHAHMRKYVGEVRSSRSRRWIRSIGGRLARK